MATAIPMTSPPSSATKNQVSSRAIVARTSSTRSVDGGTPLRAVPPRTYTSSALSMSSGPPGTTRIDKEELCDFGGGRFSDRGQRGAQRVVEVDVMSDGKHTDDAVAGTDD